MDIVVLGTVLGGLIIGAIVLAFVVNHALKKSDSIELVQGKLENTDFAISEAISHLKITNEWSD